MCVFGLRKVDIERRKYMFSLMYLYLRQWCIVVVIVWSRHDHAVIVIFQSKTMSVIYGVLFIYLWLCVLYRHLDAILLPHNDATELTYDDDRIRTLTLATAITFHGTSYSTIYVSIVCSIYVSIVCTIYVSIVCTIYVSIVCSIYVSIVCSIYVSIVCTILC